VLRETALRAAVIDTSVSAAFITTCQAVGRIGERVQVVQLPSRLYLDSVRGEFGELDQRPRIPHQVLIYRACPICYDQPPPPRAGASALPVIASSLLKLSDAEVPSGSGGTQRQRRCAASSRRTLAMWSPRSIRGRAKCSSIGGNVNQAVSPRNSTCALPEFSPFKKGPLRRRVPMARRQFRGEQSHAPQRRKMLAQRQEMVRAAGVEDDP